jgi:hypothetical protein
MSYEQFASLLKYLAVSIGIGVAFNIGWAIIFWNNDDLFMWHWLSVPLTMLIMLYGGIRSWKL